VCVKSCISPTAGGHQFCFELLHFNIISFFFQAFFKLQNIRRILCNYAYRVYIEIEIQVIAKYLLIGVTKLRVKRNRENATMSMFNLKPCIQGRCLFFFKCDIFQDVLILTWQQRYWNCAVTM